MRARLHGAYDCPRAKTAALDTPVRGPGEVWPVQHCSTDWGCGVSFRREVEAGRRFEFGKNWASYLSVVNEARIEQAREAVRSLLGVSHLSGKSFLDAGSGSGIFSLAAARLGANPVLSFDYDPVSVWCTGEMKRRFGPNGTDWIVEEGSVLDTAYVSALGTFGVVYCWGVVHHTGRLWQALYNISRLVAPGGHLVVAVYNDQGHASDLWRMVKRTYVSGGFGRGAVTALYYSYHVMRYARFGLRQRRNPYRLFRDQNDASYRQRGMSMTHDWKDWLGGYPFEVASREAVIDFLRPL